MTTAATMFRASIFVAILTVTVHAHSESTVLTYNTLLTPQYDATQNVTENATMMAERRDEIIQYVRNIGAEVVCLQGVSYAGDVEQIIADLNSEYKYSYSLIDNDDGFPTSGTGKQPASCTDDALLPYANCTTVAKCYLLSGDLETYDCVYANCKDQLLALPQKCLHCLAVHGLSDVRWEPPKARIVTFSIRPQKPVPDVYRCTGSASVGNVKMNDPGLLLLSKRHIKSASYVDYHPGVVQFFRRGYLNAYVEGMGDVTCTQLSPITPNYTEPHLSNSSTFTNFKDQNADEIQKLIKYVHVTKRDKPHIILGDFSTGPAVPDQQISAAYSENYDALLRRLNTTLLEECTYCRNNSFVNGQHPSVVIDHIFMINHYHLNVSRVFDKRFVLSTHLPLSSHYGVLGRIELSSDVSSATGYIASLSLILATWLAVYCL